MVKIEAGKYYRTCEGEKVGPMRRWRDRRDVADSDDRLWSDDGRGLDNADLVSEWPSSDFDPNWPHGHVTRDGRKVRVICTDAHGELPVVALVPSNGEERPVRYGSDGREVWGCDGLDLLNAHAPKREFWVNVYEDGASVYAAREEADDFADVSRIACVHVTEGDGL